MYKSALYVRGDFNVDRVGRIAEDAGLRLWPEAGAAYLGLVSRTQPPAPKGTVVVFHGNAYPAAYRDYYVKALEPLGYRVVLAEYPGYGGRPGPVSERSFVADGLAVAQRAQSEFGGPLYLWGESLGCGVASAVAADRRSGARGLIMLTPWDTLPNLARRIYPFLPVGLIVREKYDNVAHVGAFAGPVAFVVAGRDEVIPGALTARLCESRRTAARVWRFEDAGHNDWPSAPGLAWWAEVMDYVSMPPEPAPPKETP